MKLQGVTSEAGTWIAAPLPVGNYTVTVERLGFQTAVASHVIVEIQQTSRVPVALAVGDVKQEVVVTAESPLLQTEDVEVG